MSDLLEAVEDLTSPRPVKVQTDDGHTWATEDALLVQLADAVSSSLKSGSGSGGAPWQRNVIDSDALYRAGIITSTIGDWCRMAGAAVTRDATTDLRSWHVAHTAHHDHADEFYIAQMKTWATQIRAMVNPPKLVEITAPCPVCGQGEYVNDMGERIRNPLALVYRPDSDQMYFRAKVMCRSCETVWLGPDAMEELRDELNEKESA
ncbi:hypothetical protein ACIPY5_12170 [Microbacterium sp. NPDC089698]|uniref:DUF7341 domain-containing protein n=1 Tax=Microbacterium sp. NPDC089698 TaxID=3364200 RepID=UPI0038115D99